MNFDSFFDKKLDTSIKFGVKLYTRNFDSINTKLRNNESLSVIENIVLKCLYIAYAQIIPRTYDLVVYRGTRNFTDIKNNSFISTSSSKKIAKGFMINENNKKFDCCLFTITIPSNTRFVPILDNSYYNESEILLPPQSTFEKRSDFNLIYHPPEHIPTCELSGWDIYLLLFFEKVSSFSFVIEELESVLVKEYITSLLSLINTENLLNRFHLCDTFIISLKTVQLWKDIIQNYGSEILQLVTFIHLTNHMELEFLDMCPNIENLSAESSSEIFRYINNLNRLSVVHILPYKEPDISELNNLNLKELTIENHTIGGTIDLKKIHTINLTVLSIKGIHIFGEITINNLTNLALCDCDLDSIPESVYNLHLLTNLDLSDNKIHYIDTKINEFTILKSLKLVRNLLEKFPIVNLTKLERLWITYRPFITQDNNLLSLEEKGIVYFLS